MPDQRIRVSEALSIESRLMPSLKPDERDDLQRLVNALVNPDGTSDMVNLDAICPPYPEAHNGSDAGDRAASLVADGDGDGSEAVADARVGAALRLLLAAKRVSQSVLINQDESTCTVIAGGDMTSAPDLLSALTTRYTDLVLVDAAAKRVRDGRPR